MADFASLKVPELRSLCEAANVDSSGTKKVLIERLTASSTAPTTASSDAPTTASSDALRPVSAMPVGELKSELESLGEDTKGKKVDLAARLEAARAGGKSTAAAGEAPQPKRQKSKAAATAIDLTQDTVDLTKDTAKDVPQPKRQKSKAGSKWFWAADQGAVRVWQAYSDDVSAALEAALTSKAGRENISADHYVDLNSIRRPGMSVSYTQCRKDDRTKARPVVRSTDGAVPAQPPPNPPAAPKNMPAPKSIAAPRPSFSAASSSSPGPGVAMKSINAGGVQQARLSMPTPASPSS